MKIDLLLT